MSRPGVRVTGLLVAAALALAGCGQDGGHGGTDEAAAASTTPLSQVESVDSPRTFEGPSTAVLPDEGIDPIASSPAPKLPATVTSHERSGDREVEVTDTSRGIAMNLSGSIAATVYGLGLGDTLVGRDQSTTLPEAEDLPLVTSEGHSVNAEAIIELEPTVVITDGSIGPRDVVEQLRDVGITVVFVSNDSSFEGASQMAQEVAAVYGLPKLGDELAQQIEDDVADHRGPRPEGPRGEGPDDLPLHPGQLGRLLPLRGGVRRRRPHRRTRRGRRGLGAGVDGGASDDR